MSDAIGIQVVLMLMLRNWQKSAGKYELINKMPMSTSLIVPIVPGSMEGSSQHGGKKRERDDGDERGSTGVEGVSECNKEVCAC